MPLAIQMIMRSSLLKVTLICGGLFFLIGAFVHWFGLSFFPWYDRALYSPYHDSLIALFCFFLTILLVAIAYDPAKNKHALTAVIVGVLIVALFDVLIPLKINFASLGAPIKKTETIIEGVIGFIYALLLILLYPKYD